MSLRHVLEVMDLLDGPVRGGDVVPVLEGRGLAVTAEHVSDEKGATDFLRVTVPGERGRAAGGPAPTTGIVGRLGGIGARPDVQGLVSDADGAIVALSVALKLADMAGRGDRLAGDVVVATHVCPDAPIEPHDPVPFMGSPVSMTTMNRLEVRPEMDVVLTVDTTKGNRVLNARGFAITPTILQGYLLPVSDDLLDVYERVSGRLPLVLPLTTYDITPYGNGLPHVNSIAQPAVATDAPVVGVALTAEVAVPGSATGANHPHDIAVATAFCLETARGVGLGTVRFYDEETFALARGRYGDLSVLQTAGKEG